MKHISLILRRLGVSSRLAIVAGLAFSICALRAATDVPATDPSLAKFKPLPAPATSRLLLKSGDRLAICGDSITEQKKYSRIMETYLTVCVPQLKVTVRQYGWSGETAEGFLRRMTNDCLRFHPTITTTCYGMNDHRYQPYDAKVAEWYIGNQTAIVRAFKAAGARVVLGSPGCVGKMPSWVKTANGNVGDLNLNLCALRNADIEIAKREHVAFADVFWPMLTGGVAAKQRYTPDFAIAGKDGVHPDWSGQLVMAYAFLKAMGLDGDIGTFTVDLGSGKAKVTTGHSVDRIKDGELTITSKRYPFCADGATDQDNSIRAGMTLVPFQSDLNRLRLIVKRAPASGCKVTWGKETKAFAADKLAKGINLAEEFPMNPFSEAFAKVDNAVAAKQAYETRQIKSLFHGNEGKEDMEGTVKSTEQERAPLAKAIETAFEPVVHTIRIEPQ